MTGRYGEVKKSGSDFVVRRRPFMIPLTFIFLAAFAVLYFTGITSHQGQGQIIFAITLLIVIGSLSWFTIAFTRRQRDLVLLSEYQNTIFAGAAGVGAQFNLIVKVDGTIVYLDPGLQLIFPSVNYRKLKHIEQFYEISHLPVELQQRFNESFSGRDSLRQRIELTMPDKGKMETILSLDPLPKPHGYFILRGREFVERPHTTPAMPAALAGNQEAVSNHYNIDHFITGSPIATACMDEAGIVTHCNEAFRILTGRTKNRKQGWDFLDVLTEECREAVHQALLQTLNNPEQELSPIDIAMSSENGKSAAFYVKQIPNPDANTEEGKEAENQCQCMVQLIDTTDQKNLEMRYAHSQKMQAVGQLAGGVAHDFNNLLTAMIGFCDLLLMRHPAGDQSFADIMQVKQNANRAANLVRQLLAFSRRQTLQPKMLDLTDVLAELSNLIRRLIGESIELKMIHGRDIGHVKADQGQLEQVFINLAVNARDAMKEGGVLNITTRRISVKNKWDIDSNFIAPSQEDMIVAGDYVHVTMTDTGTGIPHGDIQKIFEPFYSTKEVGAGTGLGLATVYGIIKQTGAFVYVESEEHKGTSFHIYFPYHLADSKALAAQTEDKEPTGDLSGMGTILLVEDEAPVRSFAARALKNKSYDVLEADCGEAALEVIEEHGDELHVIVSDVIMPGMNGPEMIKQVMPKYPNVKVIFISGYAEDAFVDSFGADADFNFLPKPFTLKQLAAKIKDVTSS